MAQIKAAFFDIDGTLLPFHAKALPESTVQALAALRKNGVKTFIATGRPPVYLPYLHALDGIPFDGYVTMLEYAGIGVAMGNACDAAKAAADYVTDDITADGLAKALAHFGLI
ncbi:MAG: HAD hydrolase family protein [Gemmiger formicilis]|nr:HAD hydrolase family protein [Gemmiger formicilis]